jgi:hypothetical protein
MEQFGSESNNSNDLRQNGIYGRDNSQKARSRSVFPTEVNLSYECGHRPAPLGRRDFCTWFRGMPASSRIVATLANLLRSTAHQAPSVHRTAATSAMVAQLVAAEEIHWSCPWGKPLSKYGWIGAARLRTNQEPSSSWLFVRN